MVVYRVRNKMVCLRWLMVADVLRNGLVWRKERVQAARAQRRFLLGSGYFGVFGGLGFRV